MTFDAEGNLYWTLTNWGGTVGGGCIYMRRASDGTLSRVLSETDFQTVLNTGANMAFYDLFAAPDGYIYFCLDSQRVGFGEDPVLYFHPGDPAASLAVFLTAAELAGGPVGTFSVDLKVLNAFQSTLTWNIRTSWYDLYAKTLAGPVLSPADFDGDGDVDLTDYAHLAGCIVGPNQPPASSGCCSADLDKDRDVDLADFAWFQAVFP